MANEKVLKGPYWTRNWIEAMWRFTNENFVNFDTGAVDYEALGKEEFQFRKALFFRNFKNSGRAKTAFASAEDDYKNSVENGKKGGRPRKNNGDADTSDGSDESESGNHFDAALDKLARTAGDSTREVSAPKAAPSHKAAAPAVRNAGSRHFANKEEFMQWAIDSGLDATDASECWDATLERGGKDKDGNRVNNFNAFATQWCRTRAEKRRTA